MRLTIVAIAAEENVVADKVGPSAKVGALGDEHLLDELETVDDDARRRAQGDAENVAVDFAELTESLERDLVLAQQVERADDGPADRAGRRTPRLGDNASRRATCGGRHDRNSRRSSRGFSGRRFGQVRADQSLGFALDAEEKRLGHLRAAVLAPVEPDERERQGGQCGQEDGGGRHEDGANLSNAETTDQRSR